MTPKTCTSCVYAVETRKGGGGGAIDRHEPGLFCLKERRKVDPTHSCERYAD